MAETMNMMEVSIETFTEEIREELEEENYSPVIGIGKSGVGKTMSIYELTQELGIGFCELRLVTLTEVDLLGIPTIDENGRTTYASNALLPDAKRDGECGILVLDEITSATSTIRAAAYQLLDSKRALGNYKLPDKWKVIALGNGADDGGVFNGMEGAFLTRAASCYRIEPNLEVWKKWAIKNKLNSSILAFVSMFPEQFYTMDPDELGLFACPRTWDALSKKLNAREQKVGGMLTSDKVELYAAGSVGMTTASSFAGFYAYNSKTISPEDILSGKVSGNIVNNLNAEVIYLALQALIKALSAELEAGIIGVNEFSSNTIDRAVNVIKWIIDVSNSRLDYATMFLTDLSNGVKAFRDLVLLNDEFDDRCPEFITWCSEHGIVMQQ